MVSIKRSGELNSRGILTLVDVSIFLFILVIVSIFILSFLQIGFFQTSDVRQSRFKREAVIDIQEVSVNSVIAETGYINESEEFERVIYRNITVETAILNYLYLRESEKDDERTSYDLNRLENDIQKRYERCVWEISHYHFAVESEYGSSELFISDVEEVTRRDELPPEKSAASTFTTLGLEQVQITLYIWR